VGVHVREADWGRAAVGRAVERIRAPRPGELPYGGQLRDQRSTPIRIPRGDGVDRTIGARAERSPLNPVPACDVVADRATGHPKGAAGYQLSRHRTASVWIPGRYGPHDRAATGSVNAGTKGMPLSSIPARNAIDRHAS